jgi:enterochelin esterase-like enzyme
MHYRQAAGKKQCIHPSLGMLGVILFLTLVSCSTTPVKPDIQPEPTHLQPSTTALPVEPSFTPTQIPGPRLPTATSRPVCQASPGRLEKETLVTSRLYTPFQFQAYLPPCYDMDIDQHYPVLYLFHGMFFDDDQWVRLGVVEVANRLINSGEVPPFIMVFPYDPNARQPDNTPFDEIFLEELLPYVDVNFRTLPTAAYRAVGGLSRGAGWAIHFGLMNPSLFGAMGVHSPVIFWEDSAKISLWLDAIPGEEIPRIYLDIGDHDPDPDSAILLDKALTERHISHVFQTNPGYHNENYWGSQVEAYLRWYGSGW